MEMEKEEPGLLAALRVQFPEHSILSRDERSLQVVSKGRIEILPLLRFLSTQGVKVTEAKLVRPTLEEVFVQVTGIEVERMKQEREGGKK
jgi:ABC-2 type transport system ATP-binding protein